MPTTAATVIAVVPGAIGNHIYALVNGLDWRERDWHAVTRYVGFSVIGLVLYVGIALVLPLPPAVHVVPATFQPDVFVAAGLPSIVWPYVGHLVGGGIAGAGGAWLTRWLAALVGATPRPSAWDSFIRDSAPGRWVVVTLNSGDVYAGYIRVGDSGVKAEERDLLIAEPARLVDGRYHVTEHHQMYLPANLVQNVATLALPDDERVGPKPGEVLFGKEEKNVGQEEPPDADPAKGSA